MKEVANRGNKIISMPPNTIRNGMPITTILAIALTNVAIMQQTVRTPRINGIPSIAGNGYTIVDEVLANITIKEFYDCIIVD